MTSRLQYFWLFVALFSLPGTALAQLRPNDLDRDFFVKIVMKDSSSFYANVLAKPLPDRIIVETRQGRLEIPLKAIAYANDYRFNKIRRDDVRKAALETELFVHDNQLSMFLQRPKLADLSTVHTRFFDSFIGRRYLFEDSAHVIISTEYGNLYFRYSDLTEVENWDASGVTRRDFQSRKYQLYADPRSSQHFITPTARAFGDDKLFLASYMVAGLQLNYGANSWLSLNAGGVFAPFLPTQVITGTAGFKVTPYESNRLSIGVGAQGVYSEVVKTTRIGFPFVSATYGPWESDITGTFGVAFKRETDTAGSYDATDALFALAGGLRVGENLKTSLELFFIEDFGIIPTVFSIRYFQNNFTVDVAVVFSLYKPSYARTTLTLGEYVFNSPMKVIPMLSGSYHF